MGAGKCGGKGILRGRDTVPVPRNCQRIRRLRRNDSVEPVRIDHRDAMIPARRSCYQSGTRPVPGHNAGAASERRNRPTTSARPTHGRRAAHAPRARARRVPVPEGRRRRLAGGKSAPADAAPGNGTELLRAPTGHRRKWPAAMRGGGNGAPKTPPKTSLMPRWGMAHSAAQPGAAPAGAGLPPATLLRCPSGTRSQVSAAGVWCSAYTAALREKASRRTSMSARGRSRSAARTLGESRQRIPSLHSPFKRCDRRVEPPRRLARKRN